MRWYFLLCFIAGSFICLFIGVMIGFKAAHPISNAKTIVGLLIGLAIIGSMSAEMMREYLKTNHSR